MSTEKRAIRTKPALVVLFMVLKLTGFFPWSWWFVFAPLWAPWALILSGVAIAFVGLFLDDLTK